MATEADKQERLSPSGLGSLAVVYLVWSSTYLAIRVGVGPEGGFSPLNMGTIRLMAAGIILLAMALWRRHRVRITLAELYVLVVTSILLWLLCNGLVMWAEQHANSGFTALILATSPLMVALLNYGLRRRPISRLLLVSSLVSLAGLAVLLAPSILNGDTTEFLAGIMLCFCAFSWSAGTVFQSYHPLDLSVLTISGYQHLVSGCLFALFMLIGREALPRASSQAWAALLYLIIFGSVLAFSAFINALNLLPINITMTYSYVNPVLALFLGWWLLDEPITSLTILGAVLVIAGVAGVFVDRRI